MSESSTQPDSDLMKVGLLILVAFMLNVGLFFVLVFFAPLIAGLITGYLHEKSREGSFVGFAGAILSYYTLMFVTEYLTGFPTDPLVILAAILIMGIIGAVGGFLGVLIRTRNG